MSKNTTRKDDKGRVLYTGESQRNGRYVYKYKDYSGKMCYVYSNRLKPTDKTPPGKKPDLSLREKIEKIQKDKLDGIDGSGDMTVYESFGLVFTSIGLTISGLTLIISMILVTNKKK